MFIKQVVQSLLAAGMRIMTMTKEQLAEESNKTTPHSTITIILHSSPHIHLINNLTENNHVVCLCGLFTVFHLYYCFSVS